MFPYIICFALSIAILIFSQKVKRSQQLFLIVIAILIPCILAGYRADSIGTDVNVYLRPIYNAAKNSSNFSEYLNFSWFHIYKYNYVKDYEIGFVSVVYITAKIFHNIFATKFIIEFLILCPICVVLRRYNDKTPLWVGMAAFYLLFFNQSLNLMRQYIAVSFLLLAIIGYLKNRKTWFYITFQVIAFLFHTSSIIGLGIFVIARYLLDDDKFENESVSSKKKRYLKQLFSVSMIGIIALLSFEVISIVLISIGLGQYIGYISGNLSFMINQVIIRIPILLLCFFAWSELCGSFDNTNFLIAMVIYTIIFSQFAGSSTFGARIAVYFSIFQIVLLPRLTAIRSGLLKVKIDSKRNISFYPLLVFFYLVFYWSYFYVILGMDATMPYIAI